MNQKRTRRSALLGKPATRPQGGSGCSWPSVWYSWPPFLMFALRWSEAGRGGRTGPDQWAPPAKHSRRGEERRK